mgnify:CR=1 FL=1
MTTKLQAMLLAAWGGMVFWTLAAPAKPNLLIILADDLGFSDVGCYGGEIATPALDRLAAGGLRFTQFYNTAKCHSSRISLLTGRYAFQAGDVSLRRAVTAAEVLGASGYFTAMAGKWHLDRQPTDFGFQRYFGHLSGACNYYRGDKTFRLNGQPWAVPAQGFYTTVANVDHALKFLGEARASQKPWFLYLAFNAPHAPLQPLEQDYRKYLGRYDAGWDVMREARVRKQAQLNLFGKTIEPSPRPEHVPAWESLGAERKKWEARRMAAYAALIDRVDQEIGRLLADLERAGELDRTLILFFSDNGACPYDRRSHNREGNPYDPDTTWSDSTGWAWARNSPFRFYKQNQFEGGIATPAIVHWPAGLKTKPGALVHEPAHLVDVLPTLAELAGARLPERWPGRELTPVAGVSLVPILNGGSLGSRPPIHLLFGRDRGLRDGDWKLVSFQSNPWELYQLSQDRTELRDLASREPAIRDRLVKVWHELAEKVVLAPAQARAPVSASPAPARHREWTDFDKELGETGKAAEGRAKARAGGEAAGLRARVGTKLTIEKGQLVLACTGDDAGLAMDQLPDLPPGPYLLQCRLLSQAGGDGEVYFTTDAKTKLPNGQHAVFPVKHDGQWQEIRLRLDTTKPLRALRFDPCGAPGEVRLEALRLTDLEGKVLKQWP